MHEVSLSNGAEHLRAPRLTRSGADTARYTPTDSVNRSPHLTSHSVYVCTGPPMNLITVASPGDNPRTWWALGHRYNE